MPCRRRRGLFGGRRPHSLKGVALGVGARELADLAASAEPLRDGGRGGRDVHIVKLRAELERVRRFVADMD